MTESLASDIWRVHWSRCEHTIKLIATIFLYVIYLQAGLRCVVQSMTRDALHGEPDLWLQYIILNIIEGCQSIEMIGCCFVDHGLTRAS